MYELRKNILLIPYMIFTGLITGLIIWTFMKTMNTGIFIIWEYIPQLIDFKYYTFIVALIGGLSVGIFKHKFGEHTEDLKQIMQIVKTEHRYSYDNILLTVISAIVPLIAGASIGPEAGLTGIIAGLCTWIGDRLKLVSQELTGIGVSAALATIFNSPLFGFVEPIENEDDIQLPKTSKNILYFIAILSSFAVFIFLNHITSTHSGLTSLGRASFDNINYFFILVLILSGIFLAYIYFISHKIVKSIFDNLKENYIIKGLIGGLALGIIGTLLPLSMFSGEHQIQFLLDNALQIGVFVLILTSIMKIILTNICIESGLKGGHFFPLIFSGLSMGYAMAIVLNSDVILSMAIVTTALLAKTMKKPIAVVMLLMILFPANLIPLMLITAVISCMFKTPEKLEF